MAYQGNLDGLCGPYAIVNAFDRCGLNEGWLGQDLLNTACLAIDGWPHILWKGTDWPQMRKMLKACTRALGSAYDEAGEECHVRVEYPFSGGGMSKSDREYWLRFNELCSRDDVVCGILGLEHPYRHWVAFENKGKALSVFDSSARGGRWRTAKENIHAGRRNRKKYRVNRKELALFRAISVE